MKDLDTKSRLVEILRLSRSTPVAQRAIDALERMLAVWMIRRLAFWCSEKNLCELCAFAPLREPRPAWEGSRKGAKAQSSERALWKAGAPAYALGAVLAA